MLRYRLIIIAKLPFMTQVAMMQRQTTDQSSVLVGIEAENPIPSRAIPSWQEIRGLSWIFYEDD